MKLKAAPRIMIVATLCVAALIALVVNESIARDSGQEMIVPMEAVDPRAILSGHYVIVDLRQRLAPGENCPQIQADWDWLAFSPNGATHRLAGPAPTRQAALEIGPIPVEGRITNCNPSLDDAQPGALWIDLGVSRFHINQADAQRIERVLREQRPDQETRAFAIVSVGGDGRARLKGLMVDDERLDLSWL